MSRRLLWTYYGRKKSIYRRYAYTTRNQVPSDRTLGFGRTFLIGRNILRCQSKDFLTNALVHPRVALQSFPTNANYWFVVRTSFQETDLEFEGTGILRANRLGRVFLISREGFLGFTLQDKPTEIRSFR